MTSIFDKLCTFNHINNLKSVIFLTCVIKSLLRVLLPYLHFALMLHLGALLLHPSQIQGFFGMAWMEERGNNTEVKGVKASNTESLNTT